LISIDRELATLNKTEVHFTFDGRELNALEGDTIAAALWRNGIKVITRSTKFHRPRGLYCGTGDCPNCLANVNGVPNVRTCITPVEDGMIVIPQNMFLSMRFDPVAIMDRLYPHGFNYHHRFIRPRFMTGIYQRIIRRMTGIGRLPTTRLPGKPTVKINSDIAIIGDEACALRIADICSKEGLRTILARTKCGDSENEVRLKNRENIILISGASAIGAFDDGSLGIATRDRLYISKSKAICIAEKGRELPLRFVNWDLPGIIQSRAAMQLIDMGIKPGREIVIAGETERAIAVSEMLSKTDSRINAVLCYTPREKKSTDPPYLKRGWRVIEAYGRNELRKIRISDGEREELSRCDCLITCGRIAPNIELARQLGCHIETDGRSLPYVKVNPEFETSRIAVFAIGSPIGRTDSNITLAEVEILADAMMRRAREMG